MGDERSRPQDRAGADGAFGFSATIRYAHFAPPHASRSIIEAQRREAERLAQVNLRQQTSESAISDEIPSELVTLTV